jgi:ABC-type antimicrobial peptide transport system permease subunit
MFGRGHNNFIYVRTRGDPNTARATLRHEVAALDPTADLYDAMSLTEYTQASLYPQKVAASLLAALGILSILLAAAGLYSVMSYAVSERTQEIGIRMALGSSQRDVLAIVFGKALTMTAIGLMGGVLAALAFTRLISSLLVEVSAADPITFVAAALFLVCVALLASYVPARRATQVDPIIALRSE